MIRYNESVIESAKAYRAIIEHIGAKPVTDNDVWNVARESRDIPSMDDILLELLFTSINDKMIKDGLSCIHYVVKEGNSYLSIMGKIVYNLEAFLTLLEEYKKAVYTRFQWMQDRSLSPREGQEVEEDIYYEMLDVLPPARMKGGAFLVGEPYDFNEKGEYTYECFDSKKGKYYYVGKMSKREFDEMIRGKK